MPLLKAGAGVGVAVDISPSAVRLSEEAAVTVGLDRSRVRGHVCDMSDRQSEATRALIRAHGEQCGKRHRYVDIIYHRWPASQSARRHQRHPLSHRLTSALRQTPFPPSAAAVLAVFVLSALDSKEAMIDMLR